MTPDSFASRPPLGFKESRMAKNKTSLAIELKIETDDSERIDSGGTPIDDSSASSIAVMLHNLSTQCSDLRKNQLDQESLNVFMAETVSLQLHLRDIGVTANKTLIEIEDEVKVEVDRIWEMFGLTEQLIAIVQDISIDTCHGRKYNYVLGLLECCESMIKDLSTMKHIALKDWQKLTLFISVDAKHVKGQALSGCWVTVVSSLSTFVRTRTIRTTFLFPFQYTFVFGLHK